MTEIKKTREKAEDFVGREFNNGKLKVIGIYGKDTHNVVMFKVTCEICTQDSELFPDGYFVTNKASLINGHYPCGCSKSPKLKAWQFLIKAQRIGKEKSFIVHGFMMDYVGQKTRLDCECLEDGYRCLPHLPVFFEEKFAPNAVDHYLLQNKKP